MWVKYAKKCHASQIKMRGINCFNYISCSKSDGEYNFKILVNKKSTTKPATAGTMNQTIKN